MRHAVDVLSERVRAVRVVMTDEILRKCSAMPRSKRGKHSAYAKALAVGSTCHEFKMDYDMFKYLVEDIDQCNLPRGSVTLSPTVTEVIGRTARLERHVIFENSGCFFDWLGITRDMNRGNILVDDWNQESAEGKHCMRIMGAVRQGDTSDEPIQILVGRSAPRKQARTEGNVDGRDVRDEQLSCIEYAESHWDEELGEFVVPPSITTARRSELVNDAIDSAFSMSW